MGFATPFFQHIAIVNSSILAMLIPAVSTTQNKWVRSVLTLPQDSKGHLALEEVTWFEGKSASKLQGQWSAPSLPSTLSPQCPADRRCETKSVQAPAVCLSQASIVLLFIKHSQLTIHLSEKHDLHNGWRILRRLSFGNHGAGFVAFHWEKGVGSWRKRREARPAGWKEAGRS